MKTWLHLCRLFCCLNIIFAIPAPLHAVPLRQDGITTLQLENQSDQPLATCEIFAVHMPSAVVLDFQEQIDLAPGEQKPFSVPTGRDWLLVSNCDQNVLAQQQALFIAERSILPLSAQASPTQLSSQPQQPTNREVVLHIRNQTEQTICYVYIINQTETNSDEGQLFEVKIAAGEIHPISLAQGDYNLLLADCDGNVLMIKRNLTINQDYELPLMQADISRTVCDIHNQEGTEAYLRGYYEVALAAFQTALVCFRETGNRIDEGDTLNNIGLAYHAQGQHSKALENYEQALAIARAVNDQVGESNIFNSIGMVYYVQGRYSEALNNFEQALAIARILSDQSGEGTTLNNIAAVYRAQGRYSEALRGYKQALTVMQEIGDYKGEGTTLNNIGLVYHNQGRYSEALESYKQALTIVQEIGDRASQGATLNNIGGVYHAQGQYNEALDNYEQALAIRRSVGDRTGEGTTLNNIGGVYQAQGRYTEALDSYGQALTIRRMVNDRAGESATLNNIGQVYRSQGHYAEALDSYEQALTIAQSVGDRASQGSTFNSIGGVFQAQGRYAEALDSYEQALAIAQAVGNRAGEGAILNNIGQVYRSQGRYAEALDSYEQALAIAQAISDSVGQGTTLNNIGLVYYDQTRYSEALDSYEQALAIAQKIGDRASESATLNNIALVYHVQGRYSEALGSYEQAQAIVQAVGDQAGKGAILNNIGAVFYHQGQYDQALLHLDQALAIRRAIGNRVGEGTTLNNIGAVYDRQRYYKEALQAYIDGIEVLESVRSNAGVDQARTSFVNDYSVAYNRVISLYHEQGTLEQAFWYSERGRARVLLDIMNTGQVQLSDNEAAPLLAAEQEAYAVRQSAQDALAKAKALNPPDPVLVAELETQLTDVEKAYEAALAAIQSRQDQLMDLVPSRSKNVLPLDAVQAQLDGQTTLLSYWMLEDKTLAFIITANDFNVVELPNATTDAITATIDSLYQWSNPENPHPRPLRNLYQWLVEPLVAYLHTPHIAIIPHQALHYVPFAALTDGQTYFGEQYLLTQLPSASIIPFLNQNEVRAEQNSESNAVVLGNPITTLSALPYAEAEAVEVADLLNATVYTGAAASELQLRTVVSGANVLHLAAHGNYNTANALYSAIALATDEEGSYDGLLETHEIFGLPLQGNKLVMLSACETNVGAISRGDEVVGLTRAFFFAGSPTVISSLWNVDDSATGALMTAFYRHWKEDGMSKAKALQAAQADVRANQQWASPFYWAGFVLNGHPGNTQSN